MSTELKKEKDKEIQTHEGKDAKGRVISVRKPALLKQYKLVAMLGKAADSDRYMSMVQPLLYLYSIDGDDDIQFSTVKEMEFIIQKLGEEGMEKLVDLVNKHFQEEDAEKTKDEIKK